MSTETRTFKAVITSAASKIMNKSNGSEFVVHNAKFTEGPLAGKSTGASRTIKNVEGKIKDGVQVGQEVILYMTPGVDNEGKKKFYFEISTEQPSVSAEEILAALALEQ